MPRELRFPGEIEQGEPDLADELSAQIAAAPSSELIGLRTSINERLSQGASYSDQELGQVQAELGGMFNTSTPEEARLTLFVNDALKMQLITQELEKRGL